MEIYLLDVGTTKYGDSIFIKHGNKSILIDGAHPGDTALIHNQLKKITGSTDAVNVDLLIVTHCHLDHIGCLPKLIMDELVKPKQALIADEVLGFGTLQTDNVLSDGQKKLMALLREEDHSEWVDADLENFLTDAVKLEDQYNHMIQKMKDDGVTIKRYKGPDAGTRSIETKFSSFGLKILGPTLNQLKECANNLFGSSDSILTDSINFASEKLQTNADVISAYRKIMQENFRTDALQDAASRKGAPLNNQSIVIKLKAGGLTALLSGDMQFADPDVNDDVERSVATLLKKVIDAGPYDFIKTSHHTSHNGLNEDMLSDFTANGKILMAHSGGIKDGSHPEPNTLQLIEDNKSKVKFARTDRNGQIKVYVKNGKPEMKPAKGSLDNFEPNPDLIPIVQTPAAAEPKSVTTTSHSNGFIEVLTKIPNSDTKVTVTIQIESEKKNNELNYNKPKEQVQHFQLAGGRALPPLLYVTCSEHLSRNIGKEYVDVIFNGIRNSGNAILVDVPSAFSTSVQIKEHIIKYLKGKNLKGVVIIGGYDVIPAHQIDTIDAALRNRLERSSNNFKNLDADDFIVWSDDGYGDIDNDMLPELPVSRVPDVSRAEFLYKALSVPKLSLTEKFGVRNLKRPFAEIVYKNFVTTNGDLLNVSEKFAPSDMVNFSTSSNAYYMLHGSENDGGSFYGEDDYNELYLSLTTQQVPKDMQGSLVFTGCCWGALIASPIAARMTDNTAVIARSPENSIALSYLKAGAIAYVGCTGSHYSPDEAPYNYLGKPMHDLFFKEINNGKAPAEALFIAKQKYAARIPHTDKYGEVLTALELKILKQFTCLGLGW